MSMDSETEHIRAAMPDDLTHLRVIQVAAGIIFR
jgi:hypothetical protein